MIRITLRQMHRLRVLLLLVVAINSPALGQMGKSELFGGYSLENVAGGCGTDYRCGVDDLGATTNLNGWIFSVTGYVYHSLGLSAQFSGNYGNAGFGGGGGGLSSVHRYTYQFGPVYSFRWQRVSVFAHTLFGEVSQGITQGSINGTAPSYHEFLWTAGGGVDVKLFNHLSARVAQMDYERHQVPAYGNNGPITLPTNGFRYSAGIVLRF